MTNPRPPRTRPPRAGRAFTLVEVLVTMGVLLVILTLAGGIMVESERVSKKIVRYQEAVQYCQRAMDQALATVSGAVAPEDLAASKGSAAIAPSFTARELSVLAFSHDAPPYLCRMTLAMKTEKGSAARLERQVRPIAEFLGDRKQAVQERRDDLGGAPPQERFRPTMSFRYAGAVEPGRMPAYADAWTSGGLPALIQISIGGKLDGDPGHDIHLETSVIPGLLPKTARPVLAAAPVQTKAPAPAAAAPRVASAATRTSTTREVKR